MPLSLDDIVATRVNWKPKSDNLKSLSDELGLGLDSFVFVDDDAVECSEVNTRCPEVTTLQLPRQRPLIARFLHHVWAFDHSDTTDEARMRNALYRQNAQRQTAATQALTLQDFLHDLNLSVSIERMNDDHIPRVAELFNRTNQFNATTQRYSSGEVRALLQSGQQQVLVTSAQDRFGDYGLIGVAVYGIDGDTLDVRSLLLSCRALGKRIEHQVIQRLTNIAIDAGCQWLQVRYVKNEKNHLVVGFLEQLGEHSTATQEQALLYRFRIQSLSVEV
jgi:FkbH-like protein